MTKRTRITSELTTTHLIEAYNKFVTGWNQREEDLTVPLPCSDQEWSELRTIGDWEHPNLIMFRMKTAPEDVYQIVTRRFKMWHEGWSFLKNELTRDQVRNVWTRRMRDISASL